ncbi:MAG: DUF433 domain-containing protein [Phycisphaerales bacterium]
MAQPAPDPRSVTPEELAGDLVPTGDPLFGAVWINPARMSGTPCFFGTRVPVKNLFDYLKRGHSIPEFLDEFPSETEKEGSRP